jgi:hypothetical protein
VKNADGDVASNLRGDTLQVKIDRDLVAKLGPDASTNTGTIE